MTLETLLMEESNIKEKVTKAIEAVIEWFEEKMEKAKETFETVKEKVREAIASKKLEGKASKDVVKDGKTIIKKGQNIAVAVKDELSKLGKECSKVIKNCKDGIAACEKKHPKKVEMAKNTVKAGLEVVAGIVIRLGAVMVVNKVVDTAMQHADDKKHGIKNAKFVEV